MRVKLIANILILCSFISCKNEELKQITVKDFREFVDDTNYKTDAEKYGWSIVQTSVTDFHVLYGIDWTCPNGSNYSLDDDPVLQVSYNDAMAFAKWMGSRLPSYEEYWNLASLDQRPINKSSTEIFPLASCNIIGNVWEITQIDQTNQIRLAGGSYLCDNNTCNGTNKERTLYVDRITGNSHIGFSVIK